MALLSKPVLLIKIDDYHLSLAILGKRKQPAYGYKKYELDEGIITEGRLIKGSFVKSIINSYIAERPEVKGCSAAVLLRTPLAIYRFADFSVLSGKDMEDAVGLNYDRYLPVSREEYILDYRPLRQEDSTVRAMLAAIPRSLPEPYLHIMEELRLKAVLLDLYPNCLADMMKEKDGGGIFALSMGGSSLLVIYMEKGRIMGVREIPAQNEERLAEEVRKLSGYFSYPSIERMYFLDKGGYGYKPLLQRLYPDCGFIELEEPGLELMEELANRLRKVE